MHQYIAIITLVVKDYDEAIAFYTQRLAFKLLEDSYINTEKRWVLIAPKNSQECAILLAKAANNEQKKHIGNQTGGRVFLFLYTDSFWEDYQKMLANKIRFLENPRNESYGIVVVFEDLYGNKWDLIEPKNSTKKLIQPK
ncbi:VOC family protein [Flavobacterium sp. J27]|uniref:VOC family protein n=1 Tax=Flavobacterium sp. J27 TaxID=2060419 RepID=UPI0010301105|nr:VOC family protein [Flavobacterium sp. J27]